MAESGGGVGFLGRDSKPPSNQLRALGSAVSSSGGVSGEAPGKNVVLVPVEARKSSNLDISQLVGRFQL